jgi:hypothetical protein
MNLQEPLQISSIDLSKIIYPKQRTNQNKKIILIKLNDKSKYKNFVFQTPTLLNLSKPQLHNGYAEIELALEGKEKSKVAKFINFLSELETQVKADAQTNAFTWFNITDNNNTINFQKIVRESEDYSNGTIKIKIVKNNDFETMVQLNNNKRISIDNIPENSWCKMILEAYAVWVNSNNDFGIFFRPILVSFTPKDIEVYNYKFVEESDEENDFDIPDTEVKATQTANVNVFMNINNMPKNNNNNDTTSQLEINCLLDNLHTESESNIVKIDLSDANLSDSESEIANFISLPKQNEQRSEHSSHTTSTTSS